MLDHLNARPAKQIRVVIIGAGGFVGGAIQKQLEADGVMTLPLRRQELDLLADGSSAKLKGLLRATDSVVMVSAIAPAKTVPMLMQNLRMVETVCAALAETEIAHLVYISSDAVYVDDANPVTERSLSAPSTVHGMMHAAPMLRCAKTNAVMLATSSTSTWSRRSSPSPKIAMGSPLAA